MPLLECALGETEVGEGLRIAKDLIEGLNDVFARAPGDAEVAHLQGAFVFALVAFCDVSEQLGVASAPSVDRLFDIAHLEEGTLAGEVLHRFIDEVLDDGPLHVGGVLEFV